MKRFLCAVLLVFGFAGTASAQVVNGVVTAYVDLYAGPDVGYPPIAQLPAGTPVAIQGCITGWTWCDVVTMGTRGWVAGTFVQYTYQSQPVIVADYGARIGVPIVAFSIGLYWDNYYRNRPFYRNRDYWYGRPYAPRPPPRPPGWHPGYRPPPNPGHRPPPPPAHRPPPNQGHRPPPPSGNRPPPQGNRPPSNPGNRPPPNQGNRPPPGQGHQPDAGNRPSPSPGARPPSQGNRPPQGGNHGGSHGGQKPPPKPPGNQGNSGG
ncbi:MAG TPA: SH3 domain-containing protein [Dyella sp.]|uniref:SH3 domain-containing protein n=1 Tax=Dyella sp. TaxID=1869338 RepID=UPI002D7A1EC0|nr:SH3 domain-containing protein [Dyella sp.]HET6555095.1 SH3 domain-containing protein [Dyella sp.]